MPIIWEKPGGCTVVTNEESANVDFAKKNKWKKVKTVKSFPLAGEEKAVAAMAAEKEALDQQKAELEEMKKQREIDKAALEDAKKELAH